MRKLMICGLFVLMLFATGTLSAAAEPDKTDRETEVKPSEYHNSTYGITLAIPANWFLFNRQQNETVLEKGGSEVKMKDENLQNLVEEGMKRSEILFTIFRISSDLKSPTGSACILCMSMNLGSAADEVERRDILLSVQKVSTMMQGVSYQRIRGIYEKNIDGVPFSCAEFVVKTPHAKALQSMQVTIRNRHALMFLLTYPAQEDFPELEKIVDGVKFSEVKTPDEETQPKDEPGTEEVSIRTK